MSSSSKMYICVRDAVPDFMVPTLVGHAVLRHHMFAQDIQRDEWKPEQQHTTIYKDWLRDSFKKCVVRMNVKEFNKVLELDGISCSWENSTLNGAISCVTIVVDKDVPNVLKFAKLWSPKND